MNNSIELVDAYNYTLNSCIIPHRIHEMNEFITCYKILVDKHKLATAMELLLIMGVIFFNGLVVVCMIAGTTKKTCFDKILFGYCLVDGVTGLIDMPPYHISKE